MTVFRHLSLSLSFSFHSIHPCLSLLFHSPLSFHPLSIPPCLSLPLHLLYPHYLALALDLALDLDLALALIYKREMSATCDKDYSLICLLFVASSWLVIIPVHSYNYYLPPRKARDGTGDIV